MIGQQKLKALAVFGMLSALFLSFDTVAQSTLSPIQTLSLPPDPNPYPPPLEGKAPFGARIAIDGRWMLVAPGAGRAVYAYKKDEAGQWIYKSELAFPHGVATFSRAVLSDKTAVLSVGPGAESSFGFLYVFVRQGDTWRFVQSLTEPEPAQGGVTELFGFQLAVSGNTLVATNPLDVLGAAYVYSKKPNGKLVYRSKLTPAAGVSEFGIALAVDGNSIAVGSREGGGSVHLYRPSRRGWTLEQTLKSPPVGGDPTVQQLFGNSIALGGKTLIVASPNADWTSPPFKSGTAFVYRRSEGDWQFEARLDNPLGTLGRFGVEVAADGRRAAVSMSGAVFTFARSGGSWSPEGYILGDQNYGLGSTLELESRTLAVGQLRLPTSSPVFDGRVDLYRVPGDEES